MSQPYRFPASHPVPQSSLAGLNYPNQNDDAWRELCEYLSPNSLPSETVIDSCASDTSAMTVFPAESSRESTENRQAA